MRGLMFGLLAAALLLAGPLSASAVGQAEQETPTRVVDLETRVAAMVREALRAPEKDENWACLDLAISEMNAPAGDGQLWSSQAKRVADSLSCPSGPAQEAASSSSFPPTPPGGPRDGSSANELLSGAWQRVHPFLKSTHSLLTEEPWVLSTLLLLASGVMIWLGRRTILGILGRSTMPTDRARSSQGQAHGRTPSPENPVAMAMALWEGGLPSTEIARRTGMAQDAVSVLLALRSRKQPVPAGAPRQQAPPSPYASSGLDRR